MQRSLHTTDLATANKRKHAVLAEFQQLFKTATTQAAKEAQRLPSDLLMDLAKELQKHGQQDNEIASETFGATVDSYLEKHHRQDRSESTGSYEVNKSVLDKIRLGYQLISKPDTVMLSDTLEDYLNEISQRVRKQTATAKRNRIQNFMDWLGSDRQPDAVTRTDTGRYLTDYLHKRGLATKSIQDYLSDISSYWKWMMQRGKVLANPWTGLGGTVRNSSRGGADAGKKRREWRTDELIGLLTGLHTGKQYAGNGMAAWTVMALYTGMRSNEIAEMKVVDTEDTVLSIVEAKNENSVRKIPVPQLLRPLIMHLRAHSTDGYLISGLTRGGADNKRNHYIGQRFTEFKNKLGYVSSTTVFHSLRKNYSTRLRRARVSTDIAEQLLGHKTQSMTYGTYADSSELAELQAATDLVSYGDSVDELAKQVIHMIVNS